MQSYLDPVLSWVQTYWPYVLALLQLSTTVVLGWYVHYVVVRKLRHEELAERRLKELYRPMEIILAASKGAFERYFNATGDEQRQIAALWHAYNLEMKRIVMTNSYLLLESDVPPEILTLVKYVDAYEFDYAQFTQGRQPHPFPGARGYPFPRSIEQYFTSRAASLSKKLSKPE